MATDSCRSAYLASLFFLVVILSACKMGPDYHRPETTKADSWRLTPATAESIANLPWWELLKDQALQQLVRTALAGKPGFADRRRQHRTVSGSAHDRQVRSGSLVRLSGHVFGLRNTNANALPIDAGAIPTTPQNRQSGTSLSHEGINVGLKWELDLWGRIRRSIEAARAQLLSREENQRAVIIGLVSNVAESYFDLRGLDYEVEITKRTLKSWDESVRLSELRFKQGAIPKLDLDRFQAERAGTAAQLADLERQVVQTENRLSILLGHRPTEIVRGVHLTEQIIPPEVPPGLPSDLLQRRPDILKVEQDLSCGERHHRRGTVRTIPAIGLDRCSRRSRTSVSRNFLWALRGLQRGCFGDRPDLQRVCLGLSSEGHGSPTQAAVAQYRKTVLTAFQEVEDALIAVQKTGEQRKALEEQVAALQSAYNLADVRYQGGRASYLDKLTAQRSLFESELGLARAHRAQLKSVVQLYKVLGGGWSPEMAKQPQAAGGSWRHG